MRRTTRAVPSLALAAVLAAASLSACSSEPEVLPQAELEERLATGAGDGATASCDGDLEQEVDAEQTCEVTVGEDTSDVRVVVSAIEDGEPTFDLEPFLSAARVGETIRASLEEQTLELDAVECEDPLEGEVGATTTCTLVPDELGIGDVTAEVTAVDGLAIDFTFGTVDPVAE